MKRHRKSRGFTFRVRDDLKNALKVAAALSGRSVAEEAAWRLERSFPSHLDGLPDRIIAAQRKRKVAG